MRKKRLIVYIEPKYKENLKYFSKLLKTSMSAISRATIKEVFFKKKIIEDLVKMKELEKFYFLNELLKKDGKRELKKLLKKKNEELLKEVLKIIKE